MTPQDEPDAALVEAIAQTLLDETRRRMGCEAVPLHTVERADIYEMEARAVLTTPPLADLRAELVMCREALKEARGRIVGAGAEISGLRKQAGLDDKPLNGIAATLGIIDAALKDSQPCK